MESIGEKLRTLLPIKKESRAGQFDLEKEALSRVRDILSSPSSVLTHVSNISDLPKILDEGLVSKKFAKKIGKEFKESVTREDQIWFVAGGVITDEKDFAILAEPIDKVSDQSHYIAAYVTVKHRVAPREFIGIMLLQPKRKSQVLHAVKIAKVPLPVYDCAGNLIYPRQMSHEEIVRMLIEKGESSNAQP